MRTSTLILTELALRHGGVRAAARAAGISQSSISAGISRFEESLSLPLFRRTGAGVVLTVEASSLSPDIASLAGIVRALHGLGADDVPGRPVTLTALFRLAEAMRLGSIRRAAKVMGIGQPQLTRQISKLEANLGAPLVLRDPQGIVSTPEGDRVLQLIDRLENAWRGLSGEPEPRHSLVSRQFSLGTVIPATARGDLARFVSRMVSELYLERGLTVSVASAIAEELLAGLDSNRFDAVLIDTDLADPSYRQHVLSRNPVALFGHEVPTDFGDAPTFTRALSRHPFLLQSRRSGLRQRAEAFLDAYASRDWRKNIPIIEIDSLPVIVNMVESGQFNSLLPQHVGSGLRNVDVLPLPPTFDQRMQLTWRRTPRTERLAQVVVRWVDELATGLLR